MTRDKKDVLIVDDDDGIRRLLEVALTRLALSYDTAVDGADALVQVQRTQYTAILLDLMMPRLDGEQFVHALRGLDSIARERPVILMMTASVPDDLAQEMENEIQAVIQKPFDLTEIAEMLNGCVAVRRENDARRRSGMRPMDQARLAENETNLSLRGR